MESKTDRKCSTHGDHCDRYPTKINAWGSGFSCTSYSSLNAKAPEMTAAMAEAAAAKAAKAAQAAAEKSDTEQEDFII